MFHIKYLEKDPDPEYYGMEVKRLKIKFRKAHNGKTLGEQHPEELKRISKQLLVPPPPPPKKKNSLDFFRSVLSKEVKCWSEFYKYVKRRKRCGENIPAINCYNVRLIIDPIEKVNSLHYYHCWAFSSEGNTKHIQRAKSGAPFTVDTKIIRQSVAAI